MSDASIVLVALATTAVIYVLCRDVDDCVDEELDLPPESKVSVAVILLLWHGMHYARNPWLVRQSGGRTTVVLLPLFLLLVALIIWKMRQG